MSKHSFAKSLAIGKAGEALLLELWPELVPTDGRRGDFLLPSGDKMEVKSDNYDHTEFGNFFMERWSDFDRKKPGGPWQALEHGAPRFFYWFPKARIGYIFHTSELVELLEHLEHTFEPKLIQNTSWLTVGYKVPRGLLKTIYIKKEFAK